MAIGARRNVHVAGLGRQAQTTFPSKTPVITPRTMRGHTGRVNAVVHLPGERHIITCSSDGSIRLLELESGAQIGKYRRDEKYAAWSIALSPNGKAVASGGNDRIVRQRRVCIVLECRW